MDNKVTDPERLKILAEEARFIESLLDMDGTDYSTKIVYNDNTVSERIVHIEEDVDLVLNRNGEYVPYNDFMVLIEHRGYYVNEEDCYFLSYQKIDEDIDRVIQVLDKDNNELNCSDDLEGLIRIANTDIIYIDSHAALDNDYEFVDNCFWVKKVKILSSEVDKTKLTFVNDLEEAINRFYPDNWWFQEARYTFDFEETIKGRDSKLRDIFNNDKEYCLLIKFPYIKITNSANQSHEIEDLYVILPFNKHGNTSSLIYGFRGVFTNVEMSNYYNHSHLPGLSEGQMERFCLGSGPLVEILHKMATEPFNKDRFSYFLANLTVYVEWESLDGGPYRKIGDMVIRTNNITIDNNQTYKDLKPILDKTISDNSINLSLLYDNETRLLDIDFKKLENYLSEYLDIYLKENPSFKNLLIFCYKDDDLNQYFTISSNTVDRFPTFLKSLCKIKDKEVFVQIKNIKNKNTDYRKVIHPNITNYAKKYLARRINEHYFKENKN